MLVSLSGNRVEVRLRDYVGTVAQDCLMLIDTSGTRFDGLVQRVGTESMRAQMHSVFDADRLAVAVQAVDHSRGTSFGHDFVFNNLSAYGVNPRDWEPEARSEEIASGALRDGEEALRWWDPPWTPPALVQINLLETEPALVLGLMCGDTARVPQAERALLLRGTERLLVAAAAGDLGLGPGHLAGVTGLEPVARGGHWLCINSCWVDLFATQRLAEEALPGAAPRVFAVPGPDGGPVLTAYLAATGAVRTPGQAHAACMRALPGRHTAMAPGWYVLCARTPSDPLDLAAWQREPALGNGDGRPDGHGVHELSARA